MRVLIASILSLLAVGYLEGQTTIATFDLEELYGTDQPAQPVEFPYKGGYKTQSNHRLLGPDGATEVPWMQTPEGKILISTRLPNSNKNNLYKSTGISTTSDYVEFAGSAGQGYTCAAGDIFQFFTTGTLPGGFSSATNYYVAGADSTDPQRCTWSANVSLTPLIDITTAGSGTLYVKRQGWFVDSTTSDEIRTAGHSYLAGDPLKLTTQGTYPTVTGTALDSTTTYYACAINGKLLKLGRNANCSTLVDFTTVSTSISGLRTIWTYSLQSGAATTAFSPTNPVVVDASSNANFIEIRNGLTGIRIPSLSFNTNPTQTWKRTSGHFATPNIMEAVADVCTITFAAAHGLNAGDTITVSGAGYANAPDSVWTSPNVQTTLNSVTSTTVVYTCTGAGTRTYTNTNSPSFTVIKGVSPSKSPFQAIQMKTGTWVTVSDRIQTETNAFVGDENIAATFADSKTAISYKIRFERRSPLQVKIVLDYEWNRPQLKYVSTLIHTAAMGSYQAVITVFANQPSMLVEETTDIFMRDRLNFFTGFAAAPDLARYRGKSSTTARCGYERTTNVTNAVVSGNNLTVTISSSTGLSNGKNVYVSGTGGISGLPTSGQVISGVTGSTFTYPCTGCSGTYTSGGTTKFAYTDWTSQQDWDAFMDLSSAQSPSYVCQSDGTTVKPMISWYPVQDNTGWWWSIYKDTAGSTDPWIGMFAGPASRVLNSGIGPASPSIYSAASAAGIELFSHYRSADATINTVGLRRSWGLFVGQRGDIVAQGYPATAIQPIAKQQNILAGINLNSQQNYVLTYDDPSGPSCVWSTTKPCGWTWQYLSTAKTNAIIAKVQDGTATCGTNSCYYDRIVPSLSGQGKTILDLWRVNTALQLEFTIATLENYVDYWSNILTNKRGTRDSYLHYYQAGIEINKHLATGIAILMNSLTDDAQHTKVKAYMSFMSNVLWDNDWTPWDNNPQDGYGLENQQVQYGQYRTVSALTLPYVPLLATKQRSAKNNVVEAIPTMVNSNGAYSLGTWYLTAEYEPIAGNFQLLQNAGGAINPSNYPWVAGADSLLSALTPFESRFLSNKRKFFSLGDGNTYGSSAPAMHAVITNGVNATKAQNAMYGWDQQNTATRYTYDDFFFPNYLLIDDSISSTDPNLGSLHFPGSWSNLRHGWGTVNETALWFINGDFYSSGGHRHEDSGQVTIYAHNAPLAIDWNGNLYTPQVQGAFQHNTVIMDADIGQSWSADNPPLSAGARFGTATVNEFFAFSKVSVSKATFAHSGGPDWTRLVQTGYGAAAYPTIRVLDTFAGTGSANAKTLTWNLMATGNLTTPSYTVTLRDYDNGGQLPSNGTVNALTTSALNQFKFTGFTWACHPLNGIDFDVYVVPGAASSQYLIGNFSHVEHAGREKSEYNTCNGATFRERQHILRANGTGSFETIILPWRKTTAPTETVSLQTCGVQRVRGTITECLGTAEYSWDDSTAYPKILASFDTSAHTKYSVTLDSAPSEAVVNSASSVTWTINGQGAGARRINLNSLGGTWIPNKPVLATGTNQFDVYHPGGSQPTARTVTFSTSGSTTDVVRSFGGKSGASFVVLSYGGEELIRSACSGTCSVTVREPSGGPAFSGHRYE